MGIHYFGAIPRKIVGTSIDKSRDDCHHMHNAIANLERLFREKEESFWFVASKLKLKLITILIKSLHRLYVNKLLIG